jgi:hypothetical protein
MAPDKPRGRPGEKAAPHVIGAPATGTKARITGCPCGCAARPPWADDPHCLRHRPRGARGLAAALDHLDELGLCACWIAPRDHRRAA